MVTYELIAPCHFGLESVLKKEIYDLGYEIVSVEDGKVTFEGDSAAVVRANINLRTTERILIKIGQFKAETFTELFDKTKLIALFHNESLSNPSSLFFHFRASVPSSNKTIASRDSL